MGVITEYLVYKILNDCINCNNERFNSKYDLISSEYGTINVKSSKLFYSRKYNTYTWNFGIHKSSLVPDNYFCIGFNSDRSYVERVWIITAQSKIITKSGISITKSESGLKRAEEYEVNSTPHIELYNNLNINEIEEFRGIEVCEP